jgi:predicted PurR-regulated permease PerM
MAVVFAMFFWGRAIGGVFGLILAIPLTAFLVVFWRLAREKYLPKTDAQM